MCFLREEGADVKIRIEKKEQGCSSVWLDDKRLETVLGYSISCKPGNQFVLHLDISMSEDQFDVNLKNEIGSNAICKLV